MTIAAGWESLEQLRKLFDQSQETIQRLTQENEALQKQVDELTQAMEEIYIKSSGIQLTFFGLKEFADNTAEIFVISEKALDNQMKIAIDIDAEIKDEA